MKLRGAVRQVLVALRRDTPTWGGPTGSCPIRTLCDRLKAQGWTVAVPFPIPEGCYKGICGHTEQDAWALDYAARARRVTRDVETGRITFRDTEKLAETLFSDGLPDRR